MISEYKLELEPNKYTFPQRNRIIAGLADTVVLPEAAEKSGSLITAKYALQSQTPLYVAPNSIFEPTSRGTNRLLQQQKCHSIDPEYSLLSDHFFSTQDKGTTRELDLLSEDEQKIYHHLYQYGETNVTHLALQTMIGASQLLTILTTLELQGIIYESSPATYRVCR